jgi:cytochrome b561
MPSTTSTYSTTARLLHWPMAVIIIVAWIIGYVTAELMVGHLAMTLKHQFINRDDLLDRMLPRMRPRIHPNRK